MISASINLSRESRSIICNSYIGVNVLNSNCISDMLTSKDESTCRFNVSNIIKLKKTRRADEKMFITAKLLF